MPIKKYTLLNSPFSPYVALPATGRSLEEEANQAALESVLRDKTIVQVDMLIRTIEENKLEQLPDSLQSMALENRLTPKNLLNMLQALCHFLTAPWRADIREKLAVVFGPIEEWVHGQYCVTTPALLVVQSILYSHCEWFREELFESYSAVRAYEELEVLGFPKAHRYFIAGIIAHQTLLRAAWTKGDDDPREVYGFYRHKDGSLNYAEENFQDEVIGVALQRTLFPFAVITGKSHQEQQEDHDIAPPKLLRRQLAAALILHALCLQCRHSRYALVKNSTEFNSEIKERALRFLDHILATERKQKYPQASLAFFHYGRYNYQAHRQLVNTDDDTLLFLAKRYILVNHLKRQNELPVNQTFCFPRVSSKKVWSEVWINVYGAKKKIENSEVETEYWRKGFRTPSAPIIEMVEKTVGTEYCKLKVDFIYHLLKLIGIERKGQEDILYDEILKAITEWE
ncbi:MAG: hypothetical protein NTX45_23410 [Proteobacteria bacterium]|nr:hypothetical protein [Pseudomonadota bacterium]